MALTFLVCASAVWLKRVTVNPVKTLAVCVCHARARVCVCERERESCDKKKYNTRMKARAPQWTHSA